MKNFFSLCFLLSFTTSAHAWLGPSVQIVDIYFEGLGNDQRMVIVVDRNIHTCGWNSAAQIDRNVVGDQAYQTYTSVILSAFHASTKTDLALIGCTGDRARVNAVRIMK
ncbi:MAG TPA: hypothetical protein VIZ65_05440 [Cellvibrionaceae bacterium]